MKVLYYTAVDANLAVFSAAYDKVNNPKFKLKAYHRRQFSSKKIRENFVKDGKNSDIILIQLMGGSHSMINFEKIMEEFSDKKIFIYCTTLEGVELMNKYNNVDEKSSMLFFKYFKFGGKENFYNMFLYIMSRENPEIDYKEPEEIPMNGIYYQSKSGKEKIGIIFYRNYYQNGETGFIDFLIEELEKRGAAVKAVFASTVKNEKVNSMSQDEVLEKYFIEDGKENIDILINLLMFANYIEDENYLGVLDVPILQGLLVSDNRKIWEKENYGLNPSNLSIGVALPEIDGSIITLPLATKEVLRNQKNGIDQVKYVAIENRIEDFSDVVLSYCKLKKPNPEKKVAIIFHNYPPGNQSIGCAYGLDAQESVIEILKALDRENYKVEKIYENSKELMDCIFENATNDEGWNDETQVKNSEKLSKDRYLDFYKDINLKAKEKIENYWGKPLGEFMVDGKNFYLPGILNGNIFIGIQPKRNAKMDSSTSYHSPDLPISHYYIGYYRWIKEVFKADAVIHVGKHGSLEWLPGKAVGLSESCHPDIAISKLPNVYPYIINNPGEGTQAKRRSQACLIGHLEPKMTNADLYDDFSSLEKLIDEYTDIKAYGREIGKEFFENFDKLLELTGLENDTKDLESLDEKISFIHEYLEDMKENLITEGLHILGKAPEGKDLVEFLASLTRISSPNFQSLEEIFARRKGLDILDLYEKRKNGNLEEKAEAKENFEDIRREIKDFLRDLIEGKEDFNEDLKDTAEVLKREIIPKLYKTEDEIENLLKFLEGKFVNSGPSGAPTRGQIDILPTGRNFYSLNPRVIPTRSAYKTGAKLGKKLVERYKLDNGGEYPESIGFVLFGSPTIRTKGEDIAQILYLMGLEPVYQAGSDNVIGTKPIPLEKLNRPRIDVTIRISGFFRDAFFNIVELIDEGFTKISLLDENHEDNFIKKHIDEELKNLKSHYEDEKESRRKATLRIFSAKPGAYGTGVNTLIDGKDWKTQEDLANMYLEYGSYAYGKNLNGEKSFDSFKSRLSKIDLAVKNIDNKETDVLANDDNYAYLGGMVAAAKSLGKNIEGYVGDSSNPDNLKVKNITEETRFVIRTKLLNPKWYEGLKQHGYAGASTLSSNVDYVFGWDATSEVIDDLTYSKILENFLKDREFFEWLKEANVWAGKNIAERLLEADQRGLWEPTEEEKDELVKIFLELEGDAEAD